MPSFCQKTVTSGTPRLDQPARLEDRLAVRVQAVPGAEPGVLARQVERGEGLPGRQQVVGPDVMRVERVHLRALLQVAGLRLDGLEQSLAVVEASRADVVGEAEVADVVVGQARVVVDGERVERRPEPAGPLAVARLDEPGAPSVLIGRIWTNGGRAVRSRPRFRLARTAP